RQRELHREQRADDRHHGARSLVDQVQRRERQRDFQEETPVRGHVRRWRFWQERGPYHGACSPAMREPDDNPSMPASEHGRLSNWRDTAGVSREQARELAARLELRAKAADEVSARDAYLELLAISAGERVLDVGCGSGAVTRAIARRVGERGRVVGFD